MTIHRMPLRLALDRVAEQLERLRHGALVFQRQVRRVNLLGQVIAGKNKRPAGVFLLGVAEEVGRHAELRFDLLLAVAEVVVRNDRDHHPALVARRDLERRAVVVEFIFRLPAHPVAPLPLGGILPPGQSELRFGQPVEMRGENDAARVAGPMRRVQTGIVFRQIRVARVAEDALDEIQIAHQSAGHEKAHLHRLLGGGTGHFRTNHRPQQQRNKALGRFRERRRERQTQQFRRRLERGFEQASEDRLGHRFLVVRHRKPALGDMENSLRRAPVALRVVQHPLPHAVGIDDVGGKLVLVRRQRQLPRQPVPVEDERPRRQARHLGGPRQILVEEILDPRVGRTEVPRQQAIFLAVERHQPARQIGELRIHLHRERRTAQIAQFQIDVIQPAPHRIDILTASGLAAQDPDFFLPWIAHCMILGA